MDLFIEAKTAILAALISGPSFGLQIMERVEERTGGEIKLGPGTVYPALRALERDGLVCSYEADEALEERAGRPRRYYEITGKGRQLLREQATVAINLLTPAVAK